ncbi:DUF4232 domain-containing protein [Streptomyces sp. NPDC003327]
MSTVRRSAVVLAALSTLSALALTACGPGGDEASGGPAAPTAAPPSTARPTAPATPSPAPTKPAPTKSTPAKPSKPVPVPTDGPPLALFPCATADLTFTASLAEPTTSSYLLKITNKSGVTCRALGYPVVTFGDLDDAATERGEAPGIEDALTLAPGQSAYAGLMGGVDDGTGTRVHAIAMTMNTESDLAQVPLRASTPGLYVSPGRNSVTPWYGNAEDALSL